MERENVLEITIPTTRTIKKHTEYEIVCITNNQNFKKCYTKVYRRYSDFYKLHQKIKHFVPVLPEFPKKRWSKMDKKIIEERNAMFVCYLNYVCDYVIRNKRQDEKWAKELVDFVQNENAK